jgi:predicted oxidoreductase (fatty acid repression mutant protein)
VFYVSSASVIELYTEKIAGYAAGYGTILFFDDTSVVDQHVKRHHR